MKNTQSAIEWAEDELSKLIVATANMEITYPEYHKKRVWIWHQAKAMEKEQHSNTWNNGSYSLLDHGSGEDFEQYYNKIYGQI